MSGLSPDTSFLDSKEGSAEVEVEVEVEEGAEVEEEAEKEEVPSAWGNAGWGPDCVG